MDPLLTIRDSDFGLDTPKPQTYKERRAARALVYDRENKIALLHATKNGYHKLPGGGIETGENDIAALRRETLEEIGCNITDIKPLGAVEEYRDMFQVHQISYCYVAKLEGEKGAPHLEPDEAAEGFETVWVDLPEAIKIIEGEIGVELYEAKFMTTRDLALLKRAAIISAN
jgi:ADP-ribose pyrophosphatase YjhB (NUDIX family)